MQYEEILAKVTEVLIEDFEIEPEAIKPEADFFEDLEFDSLDAVDIIVNMDKKLGVKLQNEDALRIRTVDDFVQLIASKMA